MTEIMEAVAVAGRRISVPGAVVKAGASFAAISTGGSLGREGPLVHFGAAIASAVGRLARLDPRRTRALIAAGTAAGFAAAYNTPIAAVLFVVEIVAETPGARADAAGADVDHGRHAPHPLGARAGAALRAAHLHAPGAQRAPRLPGLGSPPGSAAPVHRAARSRTPRVRAARRAARGRGALGGLLVGLCALRFAEVTGTATRSSSSCSTPGSAWLDGRPAGGQGVRHHRHGLLGEPGRRLHTVAVPRRRDGGHRRRRPARVVWPAPGFPGGYVLCGMAGAIAATTRAPIMASVLGFELSGDYAIVLPLFIATATATAVSRPLHRSRSTGARVSRS